MEVFTSIREIWVFSCYIDVMNSLFCKIILLIQVIFLFEFRYSSISLNHLMRWNDERWWEGNITMIKTITKKNAYVEQLCSICSFSRFMFLHAAFWKLTVLLLIIFLHQDSVIFFPLWIHSRTVFIMWRSLYFAHVCARVKLFSSRFWPRNLSISLRISNNYLRSNLT